MNRLRIFCFVLTRSGKSSPANVSFFQVLLLTITDFAGQKLEREAKMATRDHWLLRQGTATDRVYPLMLLNISPLMRVALVLAYQLQDIRLSCGQLVRLYRGVRSSIRSLFEC